MLFFIASAISTSRSRLDLRHVQRPRVALAADGVGSQVPFAAPTSRMRPSDCLPIVGERVGGARTVGTVRDGDGQIRQRDARVQLGDGRGVPLGDGTTEDVGGGDAVQFQLAGLEARNVHDDGDATHHGRHLNQLGCVQVGFLERRIGTAEINGLGLDLFDAALGADTW